MIPCVRVAKLAGGYELGFFVTDSTWASDEWDEYYRKLGQKLADAKFGRPLEVVLLDENEVERKSFTVRSP